LNVGVGSLPKARYGGRHGSPYWRLRHCHPPLRLRPSAAASPASWVVGAVALWSLVGRREYVWPRLARPSRGAASSYNLHDGVMRQHCTAVIGLQRLQGCILGVPGPALNPDSCVSRLHHRRACGRRNWSSFRGFVTSCGTMPYLVVCFIGEMGG
jgi:hypothetical protein